MERFNTAAPVPPSYHQSIRLSPHLEADSFALHCPLLHASSEKGGAS